MPRLARFLFRLAAPSVAWLLAASASRAQCLDWRTFPRLEPEIGGDVMSLLEYDDGSGSQLYVGGALRDGSGAATSAVLRWDGHAFSPFGSPLLGKVDVLYACDLGTGVELWAGGHFDIAGGAANQCLAHWNGSTWTPAGPPPRTGSEVLAVCAWDQGGGPVLYVGGRHLDPGLADDALGRWDGTAWSALAGGLTYWLSPECTSLVVYSDGGGPALYVGGLFSHAGTLPDGNACLARWNGAAWTSFSSPHGGEVRALCVFDDGSGPTLYAGTDPNSLFGAGLARWDGSAWAAVPGWAPMVPFAFATIHDGSTPRLLAIGARVVGSYGVRGPAARLWMGTTWSNLDPQVSLPACSGGYSALRAAVMSDIGNGLQLVAGGDQGSIVSRLDGLGAWDGSTWARIGPPIGGMKSTDAVNALVVHDDGSGRALYVAGNLCEAGGVSANYGVARFDGHTWSSIGDPDYTIEPTAALASVGSGPSAHLFAGRGYRLLDWNGTTWTDRGYVVSTTPSTILSLCAAPGGGAYIGGVFSGYDAYSSSTFSPNLARWDGTHAVPVSDGVAYGVTGAVRALVDFDDGNGPALYVGGGFTATGSTSNHFLARYSGTWSPLGSGVNGEVRSLAYSNPGSSFTLYAGGEFTSAGGAPALHVAQWNGSTWAPLGDGLNGTVDALAVFDDGFGSKLYATGSFRASGSTPLPHIARWDGVRWTAPGAGIDDGGAALAVFDDGTSGPQLFVGGRFAHTGTLSSPAFASWRACESPIDKFCFGDGSVAICPCGNTGLAGRGCENSASTGGARLNATGTTSPDALQLYVAGELPSATTLLFQGTNASTASIPFGDGLRCVTGSIVRLATTNAFNGAITWPQSGGASISALSAAKGDVIAPGSVRTYQTWYRDPQPDFCATPYGSTFNLSNAVRVVW